MTRFVDRRILGAACALTGICTLGAGTAFAQAQSQPGSKDDSTSLQEVIVTAQFRTESVQNTPLSITAIDSRALEERGQTSLTQIVADAPSVSLNPTAAAFGPSMSAYIRGIGQGDLEPALEPGV